jgi:hypothetical protein
MPWHIAQTLKEGEEIDLHLVGVSGEPLSPDCNKLAS